MDNNGIKHAVQRAKDRKKKLIKANIVRKDLLPNFKQNKSTTQKQKDPSLYLFDWLRSYLLTWNVQAREEIKKRQRLGYKQVETDMERFPLLDLNLPGIDNSSYEKAKCSGVNTSSESNLGGQLPLSSVAKNHQVRRQYTIQQGENEMVQKVSYGYMMFLLCIFLNIVIGNGFYYIL